MNRSQSIKSNQTGTVKRLCLTHSIARHDLALGAEDRLLLKTWLPSKPAPHLAYVQLRREGRYERFAESARYPRLRLPRRDGLTFQITRCSLRKNDHHLGRLDQGRGDLSLCQPQLANRVGGDDGSDVLIAD